jgi:hypothetical protein
VELVALVGLADDAVGEAVVGALDPVVDEREVGLLERIALIRERDRDLLPVALLDAGGDGASESLRYLAEDSMLRGACVEALPDQRPLPGGTMLVSAEALRNGTLHTVVSACRQGTWAS